MGLRVATSGIQETAYNGAFAVIQSVQEQSTYGIRNTGRVWFSEPTDHIVYIYYIILLYSLAYKVGLG